MNYNKWIWGFLCVLTGWACQPERPVSTIPQKIETNRTVEIRQYGPQFVLYRHGEPFYIKGAAGNNYLKELKAAGGNSLRTWDHFGIDTLLDQAQAHGLTVTVGLYLQPERQGFDYSDLKACEKQRASLREVVLKYKDHPALLMWGVGNEMSLRATNNSVWEEVNRVAAMIHALDPNHPTTTMIMPFANISTLVGKMAPEIDLLSINMFGELAVIPERVRKPKFNYSGPYIISEWGGQGWWESYYSDWQTPLEMPYNGGKMDFYRAKYASCMKFDTTRCIGSYVFYWGHKQERTHTWFSSFLETGEKTGLVDVMQYEWTGEWPENRSPEIQYLRVHELTQFQKLYLEPNHRYDAEVLGFDHEGDSLSYQWEMFPEGEYLGLTGGDLEVRPDVIEGLIETPTQSHTWFTTPAEEGPYRLFITLRDGKGSGTVWNATFFVLENSLP